MTEVIEPMHIQKLQDDFHYQMWKFYPKETSTLARLGQAGICRIM